MFKDEFSAKEREMHDFLDSLDLNHICFKEVLDDMKACQSPELRRAIQEQNEQRMKNLENDDSPSKLSQSPSLLQRRGFGGFQSKATLSINSCISNDDQFEDQNL